MLPHLNLDTSGAGWLQGRPLAAAPIMAAVHVAVPHAGPLQCMLPHTDVTTRRDPEESVQEKIQQTLACSIASRPLLATHAEPTRATRRKAWWNGRPMNTQSSTQTTMSTVSVAPRLRIVGGYLHVIDEVIVGTAEQPVPPGLRPHLYRI